MTELENWLEQHGLAKYRDVFVQNELELEVFDQLNEEDLRELGLPMGPRKKFLKIVQSRNAPASHTRNAAQTCRKRVTQRRRITALFCDIVESTRLAADLDPEEFLGILDNYYACTDDIVGRFGGRIAKRLGDGVLAIFGYPDACDDDPERAVRAALYLVETIDRRPDLDFRVRIGIDTGDAIIDEDQHGNFDAIGDPLNSAARMQSMAAPGTVIAASQTQRLAGNAVKFADLGLNRLKGFEADQRLWQATGVSAPAPETRALTAAI